MTDVRRGLIISPEFPYPLDSGGRQRTFHILKGLARFCDTDLLTFSENSAAEDRKALETLCTRIDVVPLPPHSKNPTAFLRRNLSRAIRGVNPLIDRFSEPVVREPVREWLMAHLYDVVMIEHSWIAHYITDVRASPNAGAFTVLDAHNIESELWRQYYQQPEYWVYKPALYRYWQSVQRAEATSLPGYDLVLAASDRDAERLHRLAPRSPVSVIPNGIEFHPVDGWSGAGDRPPVTGFIGSLDYLPNQLGLEWFLKHVWLQVKSRVVNAQLIVIGRGGSRKLIRRCRENDDVRLAGFVPNLGPHLNRISVMIVPLQHGSGTRIKILEAWAHGMAVVSTAAGAEGIGAIHMENIWLADTADEFATAVVYLLTDGATRDRLTQAAYQHVSRFSWQIIEDELVRALGRQEIRHPTPSPGA